MKTFYKKFINIFAVMFVFVLVGCENSNNNPVITFNQPLLYVEELVEVQLKSTAFDSDGFITSYSWQQISGVSVELSGVDSNVLSFTTPDVTSDEVLIFSLRVTDNDGAITTKNISVFVNSSLADNNQISDRQIVEDNNDLSVFISALDIDIERTLLRTISFSIQPKMNAVAGALTVTYKVDDLVQTDMGIRLPVFGMYSDYHNDVKIELTFTDNSIQTVYKSITTGAYIDPNNMYDNVNIVTAANINSKPSYSYFFIKSATNAPLIMDIDGNVRWSVDVGYRGFSSIFSNGSFIVASNDDFITHHLSGIKTQSKIIHKDLSNIVVHHNIDNGKYGFLVEITADKVGKNASIIESILLEIDHNGVTIKEWDFSEIIRKYMTDHGDNPDNFVRDGVDWFHMNSAIYDASDDSIIVSSRENFVIKADYSSGNIKWIFGDETKHWAVNYHSLWELSLISTDMKPIGQHALSLVDDELMLFNNGLSSLNQPEFEPEGINNDMSHASRYIIDPVAKTANLVWDYNPGIQSIICSSIYKDQSESDGDYLVNYAVVGFDLITRTVANVVIQGIDDDKNKLFEFHIGINGGCPTSWNSIPIPELTNLYIY